MCVFGREASEEQHLLYDNASPSVRPSVTLVIHRSRLKGSRYRVIPPVDSENLADHPPMLLDISETVQHKV